MVNRGAPLNAARLLEGITQENIDDRICEPYCLCRQIQYCEGAIALSQGSGGYSVPGSLCESQVVEGVGGSHDRIDSVHLTVAANTRLVERNRDLFVDAGNWQSPSQIVKNLAKRCKKEAIRSVTSMAWYLVFHGHHIQTYQSPIHSIMSSPQNHYVKIS